MQIPDLSDIPELRPVEPDEYSIRITKAKDTKSDAGNVGVMLICDIVDVDDAETLFHTLWFTPNWAVSNKEFIVAVGLDPADCCTEDFEGLEFSAQLDIKVWNEKESNVLKRVIS